MTRKTPRALDRTGGAWLVLGRDVSDSVSIDGEPDVHACMVLDVDTGLVRGLATAAAQTDAVAQAIEMGLTTPAGRLAPGPPGEVLCAAQLAVDVNSIVSSLLDSASLPSIRTTDPLAEAEDIFDSFVGHMSGRSQPTEPPSPPDWELLYERAFEFYGAAPWIRWNDGIVMMLETSIDDARSAVVVMGNSGIQHGLALYPEGHVPEGLANWEPGFPVPMPAGTLALMLDPPSALPSELRDKAIRYGWPVDAEMFPIVLRLERDHGGDPGSQDTQLMALALAAVTAHDARGPVVVGTAHQLTKGEVVLGDGRVASYCISQGSPSHSPGGCRFQVHEVGLDLIPWGTSVALGHLPWASVTELRTAARIHRPFPPGAPEPAGREVPLLVILPKAKTGEQLAAKVAELDALGVTTFQSEEGREVFVLAGANGAEQLMGVPADSPSLSDFRRRMKATRGLHIVMVADQETNRGEGTVYGLFECHLPSAPRPKDKRSKPSKGRK